MDDRVFQERMAAAMQSMREISQIISDTAKYREETMEKVNIAFDDYIREQGRYTGPGGQMSVPNNAVGPFLNACRELGYNCQPVPARTDPAVAGCGTQSAMKKLARSQPSMTVPSAHLVLETSQPVPVSHIVV